jgi:hypothetical protein
MKSKKNANLYFGIPKEFWGCRRKDLETKKGVPRERFYLNDHAPLKSENIIYFK